MIRLLELDNFKCYRHASIPFRELTILTGINSIGKSTCIQAMLASRQSLNGINSKIQSLRLNGPLVNLGNSNGIFNDNTDDNVIKISITDEIGQNFTIAVPYQKSVYTMALYPEITIPIDINLFSNDFFYLGANRICPSDAFVINVYDNSINLIGNKGEYAPWILATSSLMKKKVVQARRFPDANELEQLPQQVENWMSQMGLSIAIHCQEQPALNNVSLNFSFASELGWSRDYRTTEVGFGLTYSLPIFVAGLSIAKGGMLIVENPEAHLHPKAQSLMGQFLAVVAQSGVQVVVETHSDHVLNGIRLAAKHKKIDADKVAIDFFSRDGDGQPELITPRLKQNGKLDVWPEEFFDEYDKNIMELI